MTKPKTRVCPPQQRNAYCDSGQTIAHNWLINPAEGPTSTGVCKLCGVTKEHTNSSPEYTAWDARRTDAYKLRQAKDEYADLL